jgi:hypothetical protein
MTANVAYSANSNIVFRIRDHVYLGLSKNIQSHDKNFIEKIGDAGLWPFENLPMITWNAVSDPRVITIAVTSLAMLTDSFGFYPDETSLYVKAAWALLPTIPFWAKKFGTYVLSIEAIASFGVRAEGRFMNKGLMRQFYANTPQVQHQ